MKCNSPIEIKNPSGFLARVRCGQCRNCRIRSKLALIGRLTLENKYHARSRFITLTYRKDIRPLQHDWSDMEKFMERYRYHYGPCRFFAVGEYGEERGGAHWHAIIYGHPAQVAGPWKDNKAWDLGYSFDSEITPGRIGYVCGYKLKAWKNVDEDKPTLVGGSRRPGLGALGFRSLAQAGYRADPSPKRWPTGYRIGRMHFPFSAPGLAYYQKYFLQFGGNPPPTRSPIAMDLVARAARGALELEQEDLYVQWKRAKDEQAAPSSW